MNKRQIHEGELAGIILLLCIAVDLVVGLWFKSDILRINFLWSEGWITILSLCIGAIVLACGCVVGYISHEAFNEAVTPNGDVQYLLKRGLFRLVRHPFYLSLMLIHLSFVLILRSYLLLAGMIVTVVILTINAHREEKCLLERFGDEYSLYQQKTGMFLPKVTRK